MTSLLIIPSVLALAFLLFFQSTVFYNEIQANISLRWSVHFLNFGGILSSVKYHRNIYDA